MSGAARSKGLLADWLILATAALFMAVGLLTIRYPETVILRLAALGLPPWPAYAAGVTDIAAGALLLNGRARPFAAMVLVPLSLAEALLNLAYREPRSAMEAFGLALLAGIVFALGRRRA